MESIKNCNEPKFVSEDIPLFRAIVQDLFPTIEMRTAAKSDLVEALHQRLSAGSLQAPPAFVHKCVELYDTVLVRHGIMMVGKPFAGKSTAIRLLKDSAECRARGAAQCGRLPGRGRVVHQPQVGDGGRAVRC